ncbi:1383_t:CDS:2, partial [Funneliformis caledonium]
TYDKTNKVVVWWTRDEEIEDEKIKEREVINYKQDNQPFIGEIDGISGLYIIDMNHPSKGKELLLDFYVNNIQHFEFNVNGELIFSCSSSIMISSPFVKSDINLVCVYSIQAEINKANCQKIFKFSEDVKVINISKYDRILLRSNDRIYEWNVLTGHITNIVKIMQEIKNEDIGIANNEEYTCLKIENKIIVYSSKLGVPITTLNLNNDMREQLLYNFIKNHPDLSCLLLSLLDYVFLYSMIEDSPNLPLFYKLNSKYFTFTIKDRCINAIEVKFISSIIIIMLI